MKTETTILDGIIVHKKTYEETDFSTSDQKADWQAVCNSCESKQLDSCGACGCLLASIMHMANAKCPLNKW
jgi:hypothetical protein